METPENRYLLNLLRFSDDFNSHQPYQYDMHAAEYEMNIRLERLRVLEALSARDVAVGRLAEACSSVREKAEKIQDLSNEKENLVKQLEACQCEQNMQTVLNTLYSS